jgi:hypothetical protein
MEKGYIYKGYHEGWYSISDECFVPETQTIRQTMEGKEIVVFVAFNYRFQKKVVKFVNGPRRKIINLGWEC